MSLGAFFARELRPSHRRIVEATRSAIKTTITTGLAVIMQVVGPFGPLFAFRIGQPGISLGFFEGAIVIVCAAIMQAAIVPITGKLLDYPGLILAFIFSVFAAIAYLLSNTRLFLPLALVAIGTITTVYVGIFEPGKIGWGSTYTFDGILLATLVLVLFDTLIWPSPPEPKLLESVAADLSNTRRRFELVGQRYLDPFSAPLAAPKAKSGLAPKLALLALVEEQSKPAPERLAAVRNAVMASENIYLEVERLALLADDSVAAEVRKKHKEEIERSLKILDAALQAQTDRILGGFGDVGEETQWVLDLRLTLRQLSELSARTSSAIEPPVTPEILNFLGFVEGLEAVANLLEPRSRALVHPAREGVESNDDVESRALVDPERFRFGVKLGATITLGLLVGLTTQRADLQTILWSIAVAGQPNQYGAVVRKTILRLTGCVIGGLATLAAMLIVSQNFDSLFPYLVAIFAVILFSTYVSQSSEWLGYAGIQAGITFLICFVGLAPSINVYGPLWRFWGIVLGILTTGFVFLFLWPEYAADKVIESLKKLTRTTLAFGNEVAKTSISEERTSSVEPRLSQNLLEVLNMADQARLEGLRGSTNSAAAIEAATLLIRIAFRFQAIARARLGGSELDFPDDVRERSIALEQGYCSWLKSGLGKLEAFQSSEHSLPIPAGSGSEERVTEGIAQTTVSAYLRSNSVAQLEAYRRLPILLSQFDEAISKILD